MATISIGFKIEDKGNGFKELIVDAEKFNNMMRQSVVEAKKLDNKLVNFGSISIGLDALSSAFQQLQGFTKDFTSAYDTQMEAERQLEQVMKNTMGAREEDVQSIKDFCSAQQEIGIVGDEVQLSGAQEMATYVTMKGTLKTLIPVMNDMIAQQYGYNHTAENAVSIATMLGKVMNGQTSALSRLGYTFDDAQEQILKYGTESERAAVLAEVVGQSVGRMNQKLAETDTGRMKQLENKLGDVKEQFGGILKKADPFIAIAANSAVALLGVQKLCSGIKALAVSMRLLSVAGGAVTIVLSALAAAYIYFTSKTDETTESLKRLTDAKRQQEEAMQRSKDLLEAEDEARKGAISSLELNKSRLKDFNGTKQEEKKLVDEMNSTYGRSMGYFKSREEWYQALIKNSKAYCDQLVAEAKARKLADQIADLEIQRTKIARNDDGTQKLYHTKREKHWRQLTDEEQKRDSEFMKKAREEGIKTQGRRVAGKYKVWAEVEKEGSSDVEMAQAAYNQKTKEIQYLKGQVKAAQTKIEMPVMGSPDKPDLGKSSRKGTPQTRLQEINSAIKVNEERWLDASESEKIAIRTTVNALKEEKKQIELSQAELSRPLELNSMEDFNAEINYQQKLLATASKENMASIQQTIDSLELQKEALTVPAELKSIEDYNKALAYQQKLRDSAKSAEEIAQHNAIIDSLNEEVAAMERAAHVPIDIDKISTYKQLQKEISYYTDLIENGTEQEKKFATENLPALLQKEKTMGLQKASIGVAIDPSQARNLDEVSAAISLLEQKIQLAEDDEVEAYQRTKIAFEEKKKVLERGIEIPTMQKEISDILSLSDREMTLKIRDIGFDTLAEKIREIKKMLKDLDNPPTEGQKKALEDILSTYEGWKKKCIDTKDTMVSTLNQAQSAFSGLGDAFEMPMLNVAGILAGAIATMIQAYATASAESGKLGPIGWAAFSLAGLAQLATMVSQVKGMAAFADGGIVSGPTLGLVGEYAGARNNPEVIAPLDKLRAIIGPSDEGGGKVVFKIAGRTLVGILEKETNLRHRN
ncbi:MAG: hypothetical protein K2L45_03305 [Muribaculaceae bacterium]|nr:hypothetical protein [Muribaculaceae bacterium]